MERKILRLFFHGKRRCARMEAQDLLDEVSEMLIGLRDCIVCMEDAKVDKQIPITVLNTVKVVLERIQILLMELKNEIEKEN